MEQSPPRMTGNSPASSTDSIASASFHSSFAGSLSSAEFWIRGGRFGVRFQLRRFLPVGVGVDAASWDWAQTEFPAVDWEDVDPDLSWYEARLGKATT